MKEKETICPCCGKHHFENANFYEICPVCGWQDDLLQRVRPEYEGGANPKSLNQYKAEFEKKNVA